MKCLQWGSSSKALVGKSVGGIVLVLLYRLKQFTSIQASDVIYKADGQAKCKSSPVNYFTSQSSTPSPERTDLCSLSVGSNTGVNEENGWITHKLLMIPKFPHSLNWPLTSFMYEEQHVALHPGQTTYSIIKQKWETQSPNFSYSHLKYVYMYSRWYEKM